MTTLTEAVAVFNALRIAFERSSMFPVSEEQRRALALCAPEPHPATTTSVPVMVPALA